MLFLLPQSPVEIRKVNVSRKIVGKDQRESGNPVRGKRICNLH